MKIWCLALILVYQIFLSDAQWDQRSALILLQGSPNGAYMFPRNVRSNHYGVTVYHPKNNVVYITYSFCPIPNSQNRFCNYGESWTNSSRHALRRTCSMTVEPKMIRLFSQQEPEDEEDDGRLRCAGGAGRRYNFLYYLCYLNGANKDGKSIYDTCYNDNAMQIIYGFYMVAKPSLLANGLLEEDRSAHFNYDNDAFGYDSFNNHFENLVEPSYAYSQVYTQRPVTPPEFLPYAIQRRPLYHYMNLSPMHVDVVGAWETFLDNVRRKLARDSDPIHVVGGVIDIGQFRQEDTTQYLGNIPIPDIFWILIYNQQKTKGTVVMIHNKSYHPGENRDYFNNLHCHIALCNQGRGPLTDALPHAPSIFIYCCSVNALQGVYPFVQVSEFFRFRSLPR